MSRAMLLGGEDLFDKDDAAILVGPLASFSWFAVALSGIVFFSHTVGTSTFGIWILSLSCALVGTALALASQVIARHPGAVRTRRLLEAALYAAVPAELILYAFSVQFG